MAPPRKTRPVTPPASNNPNLGRQWKPVSPPATGGGQGSVAKKDLSPAASHLGNDVHEVHPDGSFSTSLGSHYQHLGGGRYSRLQDEEHASSVTAPKGRQAPFHNTVFLPNPEDGYAVRSQFEGGHPFKDHKGNLLGRYYDDSGLDKKAFMATRRTGASFDDAYVKHGGTISVRPVKSTTTPQVGHGVWEFNNPGAPSS